MAAADGDEDWEICNCDGFVYKRRRVLHPPDLEDAAAAAATSSAPGPPPEAVLRRRRRQALLRLRARYLDELSRWESLSSDVLAPLPAAPAADLPPRPPSDPVAASPPPGSSSSSSDLTVIDGLLAQAEVTEQLLKRLTEVCDEIDEFCHAHEAALVDAVTDLPVWGDPRELMNSLCSPAELPVCGDPREVMSSLCSPGEKPVSDIKLISELVTSSATLHWLFCRCNMANSGTSTNRSIWDANGIMPQAQAAPACITPFAASCNNHSDELKLCLIFLQLHPISKELMLGHIVLHLMHMPTLCLTSRLMGMLANHLQNAIYKNPAYPDDHDQNAISNNPAYHHAGYDQKMPSTTIIPTLLGMFRMSTPTIMATRQLMVAAAPRLMR
uniref:Uncharacterized protein n=1 Tax=Oryza glumipatula TaxID=40148 RepID=A0A0D9YUF4_9ORYZ